MSNNLTETTKKIKRCFNKAAQTYDLYSHDQKRIGEILLKLLGGQFSTVRPEEARSAVSKGWYSSIPALRDGASRLLRANGRNIIDLGCGTGFTTKKLAKIYTYKIFYAIDIADQLLLKAKKRLSPFNIEVKEANFHDFNYGDDGLLFDLIFSNMSLHWSSSLEDTFVNIYRNLSSDGIFAFSIPLENTFNELNSTVLNYFHSFSEIKKILFNAGFLELHDETRHFVSHFSSMIEALKSIKAIGANYHQNHSRSSLNGKSFLKTLSRAENPSNDFSLTYEIGFFVARKKPHVP